MISPRALLLSTLLLAGSLLSFTPAARAEDPEVSDDQVRESIKRGVDAMLKNRNPDGTWETGTKFLPDHNLTGAETALCLYALLHVGESGEDPRLNSHSKELEKAIKYVSTLVPQSTYTASLQASALALCPAKDPQVKEAALRAKNYLLQSTLAKGGNNYSPAQAMKEPGVYDHSNSNYALVGLAALDDSDIANMGIPVTYWQLCEAMWRRDQNRDGGWGYSAAIRPQTAPPMTAAGVASLLLCRQFTLTDVSATPRPDKSLEAALACLDKEYDPDSANLYYLFTLERIGLAGGFKYIGNHNWYKEGANVLTHRQQPDGSWFLDPQSFKNPSITNNVFTAYSLMFLSRGRSPVLFNKLEYNGFWDARPRDDANITAWVAKTFEKPLAWQSVALKSDQDWLDAPILLITGSRDPKFSADDVALLKAYVNAGGIIFSTADNGAEDFTKAMKKYAAQVVDDQHEMRDLEAAHPLFNLWAKITPPPKLSAMSNGSREVWIHSPADLGASWQRKIKNIKAPFEVMGNLYYYATGKGVIGHRLDTLVVQNLKAPAVRTISLARIKYGGNWDPEPGAWPRMVKLAANNHTVLKLDTVAATALDVTKTPVAHLTGTAAIRLDDDAQAALKKFVDAGGTLFIDSTGGNKPFNDSIKSALSAIFKDQSLEPVPPDAPFLTGSAPDTTKIDSVDWRKFTRVRDGNAPPDKPRLQGIKIADRWAVIFSPDDITSGLLGTNTWGIAGYAPATAQSLARNILLYSKRD